MFPFKRALWQCVVVGLVLSLVLNFLEPFLTSTRNTWTQLYPLQALVVVSGLVIVLRWQAAQERFREGRTQLQTLTSKLTDLAVLGISLDEKNLFDNEYLAHRSEASEESKHRRFVAILVHLISLLHAVCCGTLSGDLSTDSIQVHNISEETWESSTAPNTSTPNTERSRTPHSHKAPLQRRPSNHSRPHHRTSHETGSSATAMNTATSPGPHFATQGTSAPRNYAAIWQTTGDSDSICDALLGDTSSSHVPSTSGTMHGGGGLEQQQSGSTVAVQLPASGRESGEGGGGRAMRVQLQPLRMLPETMAAISHRAQHTARSVVDSSRRYFMRQRSRVVASTFVNADGGEHTMHDQDSWPPQAGKLPVIMGLGHGEANALGMHAPEASLDLGYEDASDCGMTDQRHFRGAVWLGAYLPPPLERAHTLHAWLMKLIMQRVVEGGLGLSTDTATRARMHALLSDAMHAYEQAKKLTETRIPLASERLLRAALWIIALLSPILSWICISNVVLAALLSFGLILVASVLTEVTSELEDPFVFHTGTTLATGAIPLSVLQFKLNERLLAVSTTYRPHSNADVSDHTEAVATTAAALSEQAVFAPESRVSAGGFDTRTAPAVCASASHTRSSASAAVPSPSPLHSACVSPEVLHNRSPTLSYSANIFEHRESSTSGNFSGAAHTHTPVQLAFDDNSHAMRSIPSMLGSEAQGSVEVNFTVPAMMTASTEASADSPRAGRSVGGFSAMHGLNSTSSATMTAVQRMLSGTLQTQPSPRQLVDSYPTISLATTEAASHQTLNVHEPSMHMSTQYDSSPPTASTQAPADLPQDHALATSLSSELWVLGKLGGESPGHSRTGSIGQEGGSSANALMTRSHSRLLDASRSFQSRHARMASLDSHGLDNSFNMDAVGVPVVRPLQHSGGVNHVSSRSIVRNDEFEEVLNCSRAMVHGHPAMRQTEQLAQDLTSVAALNNTDGATASTSARRATTTFLPDDLGGGQSVVTTGATHTADMHGVHATQQDDTIAAVQSVEVSQSEDGRSSASTRHQEGNGRPGWVNSISATAPHHPGAMGEARMHVKSVVRSWPQGTLHGMEAAEGVGIFQPQNRNFVSAREGPYSEPRAHSPRSLVMWQTPADAA